MLADNKGIIHWGILGCGHIANTFADSFAPIQDGVLLACAARDTARASDFAQRHKIKKVHDDYESLVADDAIDAIYVATTHNCHFEHIMLCLKHNKHVLCEKPLTINAKQSEQVQLAAHKAGLLVIEAVWTRFLPAIAALKQYLQQGAIGNIKSLYANFSINRDLPDEHRLLNRELAGGALLDLGIYPLTMADIVFGKMPIAAVASAVMTHTGVDQVSNYMLSYENGITALLSSGFRQSAPIEALIYGDKGYIRIPNFLAAKGFEMCIDNEPLQRFEFDYVDEHKFSFEIAHFNECLATGITDSPIMPLAKSHELIMLMDELRAQFGLVYDQD